jgi:uncharacterized membrane protein YhaH (DUF805 family)
MMTETFHLLFGMRLPVRRGPYVRWGLALAALKFGIDTMVVWALAHRVWSPIAYAIPSLVLRDESLRAAPETMYLVLIVLALPFLWIGLTMSVRRAADAGLSPWLGTLFLVPLLNYPVILGLCVTPSRPDPRRPSPQESEGPEGSREPASAPVPAGLAGAMAGVLTAIAIGGSMLWLSVYKLGQYGVVLFFLTPFAMGAASATVYNREGARRLRSTIGVAVLGVSLAGVGALLFGIEGAFCLLMAWPIATVLAVLGAAVGWTVATTTGPRDSPAAMLVLLPGLAFGEARLAAPAPHDVVTNIEIDAAPERVWPNVIGFSDLTEPPAWFFRLGIAYPMRARIAGEGVGAVRRCEFSTGAFVEPITEWSPPERLAFDVTAQPPSMTEWSPYGAIHAPHLEGYMTSRGGEFDLARLPGGRTRLTGTTHYTLAIYPELYWRPYAEALLHAIHLRVLLHIKGLSER